MTRTILTSPALAQSRPPAPEVAERVEALRADHVQWTRHPRTLQFAKIIKDNFDAELALVLTYALQPDKTEELQIHARNAANYSKTLATLTQVPE